MKNLIKFSSIILLSLTLGACTSSSGTSTGGDDITNTSSNTNTEPTYHDDYYSVTIYNPDGSRSKDNITVLWCTEQNCLTPVFADDYGVAEKNIPDDTYYVHLEGVPSQYTYDPNGYVATSENRHIDIQLYDLETPYNGKGQDYNRYMINEGSFYRVNVTKNNQIIYYGFNPKNTGVYKIESYATTILSMDEADPAVGLYGTNKHYIPSVPEREDDNSKDGVNFSLQFEIGLDGFVKTDETDENGNLIPQTDANGDLVPGWSFTFGIITSSKTGTCSYDIKITRIDDYEEPVKQEINHIHATTPIQDVAVDPTENEQFTRGKLLEGEDVAVFNEEDGFYHLNDKDGILIYAKLASSIDFFETPISQLPTNIGKDVLLVDETTDYYQFVLEYAEYCNSDGAYPVNEEIKVFLDKLQAANGYFYGDYGQVSSAVPNYQKGNEWLFACGYYLEVGTIDNPHNIEVGVTTVSLKENQTIYYALTINDYLENYESVTISSTNAFAKLVDSDGTVYTSEQGFSYNVLLTENVKIVFAISYSDGHAGNMGIRIVINEVA